MKRFFVIYAVTWLIFLFFLAQSVPAYYGDIATDRESFTLSIAGQNANQITSLTALFPIPDANGWAGAYVSRQVADGKVVSEVVNGHLQGGIRIPPLTPHKRGEGTTIDVNRPPARGGKQGGIYIEAYIEATRDKWRAIDFAIETGYFIRPGIFVWKDITFSGGAGNYTERRDLDEAIGRAAADAETTFGWLAFVSGQWRNVSGVVRYKPSIDFAETRLETSLSFNRELSETVSLGITLQATLDSQSRSDRDAHTSYLVNFTYTPK